jgi:hypothetical protein
MPASITLTDVIDSAAAKLLEMAGFGAKVEGEAPVQATLPERVKAFEAAVEWAKVRGEMPQAKEPSKFERIQRDFRSPNKRRGRPAEAEAGEVGGGVDGTSGVESGSSDASVDPSLNGAVTSIFDS